MHVRFGCEGCGETVEQALPEKGGGLRCPWCSRERQVEAPALFAPEGAALRCAVCHGDDLYLQRDFPRRAGLAVMAIGALAFLALAGYGHLLAGFAVLGSLTLLDLALFRSLPIVTVCYRCGAELRGLAPNPSHASFDHHLAELAAKRAAVDRANRPGGARAGAGCETPPREVLHGS